MSILSILPIRSELSECWWKEWLETVWCIETNHTIWSRTTICTCKWGKFRFPATTKKKNATKIILINFAWNLPTSICELCPWFSLLVAADVVATAAPRFATSDSAAILSWMGWLKIWLLSAATNPPSLDWSFDAQIIANIDAKSIICFCVCQKKQIWKVKKEQSQISLKKKFRLSWERS